MFLEAFKDELAKTAAPGMRKVASLLARARTPDRLLERMAVAGGLSSAALHGARSVKAKVTNDPYSAPGESMLASAAKGAGGGLLAGLLLKALGKAHGR